ncbi:MAG: ABC transporter permease subunit [Lachnospiraceae bacterium]|nr:ABC transporter permease subunit [Lachnospiraceae bacterium]
MTEFLDYIVTARSEILALFLEHIRLTGLALAAAILIGVPLGILISYLKPASKPVLAFANLVQAIPSMALLGLTIPVLGIGMKPAVFLVVIYSLLPIIKNTYAGLMNINAQTLEAAEGIGLTKWQILFKIRIPLAMPVIMTGVRISAVSAVGLMTLAAFVGGGGLGFLVFSGIRTVNNAKILAGAIPACILALLVDRIFSAVETLVTPISLMAGTNKEKKIHQKKKERILAACSAVLLLALYGISAFHPKEETAIRIGTMDFSENETLAYMLSEAIETTLGVPVETIPDLGGSSICFTSIQSGDIDGYVEYTGTIYVSILNNEAISDTEAVYQISKEGMKEKFGLELLSSLNVNNTFTLSTTKEIAGRYGLSTISDLKKHNGRLRVVSTLTFLNRSDCLVRVKDLYGLTFADEIGVDGSPRYTALLNGEGELIDAYSTDGLLKKFDLTVLEDDLGAFPPYYAVPVFRPEILEKYPEIAQITDRLARQLSTELMAELNYLVDEEDIPASQVAHDFLKEHLPEFARGDSI